MSATFREIVKSALDDGLREIADKDAPHEIARLPELVAENLRRGLKANGYEIHAVGSCVHPKVKAEELGRPMTDDEMILVGLSLIEGGSP